MVVINYADQEQECTLRVNDPKVKSWQGYRTSDTPGEDLLPIKKLNKKQLQLSLHVLSLLSFPGIEKSYKLQATSTFRRDSTATRSL